MKLRYGESNFRSLRIEGYWYVDKTRYLELLETSPEKHIMILRSRSDSFSRVAKKEPNPAPIWAMGPSLPPDPPVVRVMAEAMVLMMGTRPRM